MKKLIKEVKIYKIIAFLMFFALNACISRVEKHGYMFEISDYRYLEEGVTSKPKAMQIMGSPTFSSYLGDEEIWFYYSEDVRKLLFFKPDIIKREVLALKFDNSEQILQEIASYSLKNEKNIAFESDFTKVKSAKKGFFSSIFNNIGRVAPQ